jgi:hypothetical protein
VPSSVNITKFYWKKKETVTIGEHITINPLTSFGAFNPVFQRNNDKRTWFSKALFNALNIYYRKVLIVNALL